MPDRHGVEREVDAEELLRRKGGAQRFPKLMARLRGGKRLARKRTSQR